MPPYIFVEENSHTRHPLHLFSVLLRALVSLQPLQVALIILLESPSSILLYLHLSRLLLQAVAYLYNAKQHQNNMFLLFLDIIVERVLLKTESQHSASQMIKV